MRYEVKKLWTVYFTGNVVSSKWHVLTQLLLQGWVTLAKFSHTLGRLALLANSSDEIDLFQFGTKTMTNLSRCNGGKWELPELKWAREWFETGEGEGGGALAGVLINHHLARCDQARTDCSQQYGTCAELSNLEVCVSQSCQIIACYTKWSSLILKMWQQQLILSLLFCFCAWRLCWTTYTRG
jgi:hypothetical protein